jgi:hypothetical protein
MTRWPPFSRDRWRALSRYLDEALETAPDRRAAWLAAICARDPALGADLTRLLAELEELQGSAFLERGLRPFGRFEDPQ